MGISLEKSEPQSRWELHSRSTDHPDHSPTSHPTSSRLPKRNVERARCSTSVSQQCFPPSPPIIQHLGYFILGPTPPATYHLSALLYRLSLAPQDTTECLNRNTGTVAYMPFFFPRIYPPNSGKFRERYNLQATIPAGDSRYPQSLGPFRWQIHWASEQEALIKLQFNVAGSMYPLYSQSRRSSLVG